MQHIPPTVVKKEKKMNTGTPSYDNRPWTPNDLVERRFQDSPALTAKKILAQKVAEPSTKEKLINNLYVRIIDEDRQDDFRRMLSDMLTFMFKKQAKNFENLNNGVAGEHCRNVIAAMLKIIKGGNSVEISMLNIFLCGFGKDDLIRLDSLASGNKNEEDQAHIRMLKCAIRNVLGRIRE